MLVDLKSHKLRLPVAVYSSAVELFKKHHREEDAKWVMEELYTNEKELQK